MFSVVFECEFFDSCFLFDQIYNVGEIEFFHVFLTASSMSEAYDRACEYSLDHFLSADVRILSIVCVLGRKEVIDDLA